MRTFVNHIAMVGATAGCMMMAVPVAATAQGTDSAANPAPDHPSTPPALHLSDAQRAQVRAAVGQENSDVNFNSAETKSAVSFEPAVGAKLPKGVTAHALPQPLISQLPVLREYTYVKFRDQILIANSVTTEIVDIIPQR